MPPRIWLDVDASSHETDGRFLTHRFHYSNSEFEREAMIRTIVHRNKIPLCFHVALLSMFLFSQSTAQITITQSGFTNLLTAGTSFYYYNSDSIPLPVNIGKQGGSNIYDFNGYKAQRTGISHVYAVGTIPTLAAHYPAKAVTFGATADSIENNPVFLFGTDTLFVLGEASLVPQRRFNHRVPYEPTAIFPVTYHTSRAYSESDYDTTYNASGTVAATNFYSGSDSVTIDGFGTLKILGRQFECLRMKLNHLTFSDKEFMYMTREGLLLDVSMASSQRDTGLVQPASVMLLLPASVVSVDQQVDLPSNYTLGQNFPNPFNPNTTISYQLSALSHVTLEVFDLLGRKVSTLVDATQSPGRHIVKWDGSSLSSGVYFYRLRARDALTGFEHLVGTKKMLLTW